MCEWMVLNEDRKSAYVTGSARMALPSCHFSQTLMFLCTQASEQQPKKAAVKPSSSPAQPTTAAGKAALAFAHEWLAHAEEAAKDEEQMTPFLHFKPGRLVVGKGWMAAGD